MSLLGLCETFHKAQLTRRRRPEDKHTTPSAATAEPTGATRRPRLHRSRAAETDGYATIFDNDRYLAPATGHGQHLLQRRRIFLDVEIAERNLPLFVLLTGGCRVRSGVFPVDDDFVSHPCRLR